MKKKDEIHEVDYEELDELSNILDIRLLTHHDLNLVNNFQNKIQKHLDNSVYMLIEIDLQQLKTELNVIISFLFEPENKKYDTNIRKLDRIFL